MSQKPLNNTTDQYISPLMGFSMGAVLAQSPVHAQTHEKRKKTHPSAHTHQCTMWHMAASSTAESVERNMEQWKRYTWGLITTLSSRLPRAQALISITDFLPAALFVLPQVLLPFFFPRRTQRWHGEPQRVTTNWWRVGGSERSTRKADGRGMCAFVQTPKPHLSRVRWGLDNQMQSEALGFFCTGCYVNLRQISIEFLGLGGEGKKREKEISRPERRRNRFIPSVKLLSHWCFLRKRKGGAWIHPEYKVGG